MANAMKVAPFPYVRAALSNIKGGVRADLTPKTLIIGDNAQKKSAIVNAIEFGLTGVVSDIRGRALVSEANILTTLAPGDEEPWVKLNIGGVESEGYIEATLSDVGIRRKAPLGIFLTRDVEAAIAGSSDTLRRFLIQFATGGISRKDVLRLIPQDLHARYSVVADAAVQHENIVDASADPPDEIGLLLTAAESSRDRARTAERTAKAHETASETAGGGATLPATEAQLSDAKKKIDDATSTLERLNRAMSRPVATIKTLRDQFAVAVAEVDALKLKLKAFGSAALQPLSKGTELQLEILRALSEAASVAKCPTCGGNANHALFVERFKKLEGIAQARLNAQRLGAAIAEKERDAIRIGNSLRQLGEDDPEKTAGDDALAPADAATVISARKLLDEARTEQLKLEQSNARWKSAQAAVEQARHNLAEAQMWKQLATSCDAAVAQLLRAGESEFTSRVQRYLPDTDRFWLRISAGMGKGGKGDIRFGLLSRRSTDDEIVEPHVSLSGAEWIRVVAAIACACAEKGSTAGVDAAKVRILTMPDRAVSAKTLTTLMRAWRDLPFQVILTSVVEPEENVAGWSTIRLGDAVSVAKPSLAATPAAQAALPAPAAKTAPNAGGWCGLCGALMITAGPGEKQACVHGHAAPPVTVDAAEADVLKMLTKCYAPECPSYGDEDPIVDGRFCELHGKKHGPVSIRLEWMKARKAELSMQLPAGTRTKRAAAAKKKSSALAAEAAEAKAGVSVRDFLPAAMAAPETGAIAVPKAPETITDDF